MANSLERFRAAVHKLVLFAAERQDHQLELQSRVNLLNDYIKSGLADEACDQFSDLVDLVTTLPDPPAWTGRTLGWAQNQIVDLLHPDTPTDRARQAPAPSAPAAPTEDDETRD
ncbi:hypothetical protein [Actinosynnema sp. NPDC020468]|uniref:hypothetical protein n=1 Tax=Actinosynnema sp. NPDC020468 TaxID=3154488 RepID=UPI0033D74F25